MNVGESNRELLPTLRLQVHRVVYHRRNGVYLAVLLVWTGPPRLVVTTEMRSKSFWLNYGRRSIAAGLCHGDSSPIARNTRSLRRWDFWRGAQVSSAILIPIRYVHMRLSIIDCADDQLALT